MQCCMYLSISVLSLDVSTLCLLCLSSVLVDTYIHYCLDSVVHVASCIISGFYPILMALLCSRSVLFLLSFDPL